MWIGVNTLEVNEATIIAAVQFWLSNKVLNKDETAPTVTAVKSGGPHPHEYASVFRISLSEPEK
jgi:hypothetical protein